MEEDPCEATLQPAMEDDDMTILPEHRRTASRQLSAVYIFGPFLERVPRSKNQNRSLLNQGLVHTRVWRRKCSFPGFSPSFCSFEGSEGDFKTRGKPQYAPNAG